MKFICSKQLLSEGISVVRNVVSPRTTLAILEGILVVADKIKNTVTLKGKDFDIGAEYIVDAHVEEDGEIVINARLFSEIIRSFPEADITVEVKDNYIVKLTAENAKFEIIGNDPEAFPVEAKAEYQKSIRIKQKDLKDMIAKTIFAISTDENRKILTGSLIEFEDNMVTMVSLDNKKMALRKMPTENKEPVKVVIPGKTLREISKILQQSDEEIEIFVSENHIFFDMGKCKFSSRLLEGEFFNYKSIISNNHITKIRVRRKVFYDAVRRAYLITTEENRYPVVLDIKEERMVVYSSSNVGNVRDIIEIRTEGKDFEIAFNPVYLMETLNAIDDDYVDILSVTEFGPFIFVPVEGEGFIYLIASVKK